MIKIKDGFSGSRDIVLPPYIQQEFVKDPLLSALNITDIGYYPEASHHFIERRQGIEQYVFIYCVNGAGQYRVADKTFEVKANQYFILPAGQSHSYAAAEKNPWTIYWIHFGGTLAPYYAQDAVSPKDIRPEMSSRISTRTYIFEEIFQTLSQGYELAHLHYASCLFHYYLGTLRYIDQYRSLKKEEGEENDRVIKAAIHFMEENIEKRLSLKQMAEFVGYSTSHFSHLFQEKMHQSPGTFFNQLKVDEAAVLLSTTQMKINQICFKVGFDDPYYFSRLFTKVKGISPSEYRKNSNNTTP
jgi:AraC-like DNA-binding protein